MNAEDELMLFVSQMTMVRLILMMTKMMFYTAMVRLDGFYPWFMYEMNLLGNTLHNDDRCSCSSSSASSSASSEPEA